MKEEKRSFFILFSESVIGTHQRKNNKKEVFEVISLTFPPRIKKDENGELKFAVNLKNNEQFNYGLNLYFDAKMEKYKWDKIGILVGFDYDDAGHSMSESLREQLILSGVKNEDIYRTPLTEAGYIMLQNFVDTSDIKKYLYLQQEFQSFARKNGVKKNVGFAKAISLLNIHRGRGKIFTMQGINEKGTSTATIATSMILLKNKMA